MVVLGKAVAVDIAAAIVELAEPRAQMAKVRAVLASRPRRDRIGETNVGGSYSKDQDEGVHHGYTRDQKESLLAAAKKEAGESRSPFIGPALALAFNAGMRNSEIRNLTWGQIDFESRVLTVGKSKTAAGEGPTIPLNDALFSALIDHAKWYTARLGTTTPDWYIFPSRTGKPTTGNKRPLDPTKPVTTLKSAWKNVKDRANVTGRLHDTRHTLITELCESGAGDQTIMEIAGHVSPQMLKRYSHIRMAAKRKASNAIPTTPKPAVLQRAPQQQQGLPS